MNLFTLPSKFPRRLAYLFLALVVSLAICLMCTRHQAEVYFFNRLADAQKHRSEALDRTYAHKVVIFGGSSCASQHLPDLCMEAGVPLVNAGLHAGLNVEDMADHALKLTRPGDVLIISAVPAVFARGERFTELGLRFAYVRKGLLEPNFGCERQVWERLWSVSGIASGQLSQIKRVFRRPRNKSYTIRPDASLGTGSSCTLTRTSAADPLPAPEQEALLRRMARHCRERGIVLYYKAPSEYVGPVVTEERRQERLRFLQAMACIVPVLNEPGLGLMTDKSLFTDSPQHMTQQGARQVTQSLLTLVQANYPVWEARQPAAATGHAKASPDLPNHPQS